MSLTYPEMIEAEARHQHRQSVGLTFIVEAVRLIEAKKIEVPRYPNGVPTEKAVYELAILLSADASKNN